MGSHGGGGAPLEKMLEGCKTYFRAFSRTTDTYTLDSDAKDALIATGGGNYGGIFLLPSLDASAPVKLVGEPFLVPTYDPNTRTLSARVSGSSNVTWSIIVRK